MNKLKALLLSFLMTLFTMPAVVPAEMVPLGDTELATQTGQALFMMDKITGTGTSGSSGTGENGITFYKMGLDAQLELNTNIKKLQLGCGGVNGPGCDIDIDNLSLSGAENCAGGRPNCDAILTRPFVQFAIENDSNAATRKIVGWRLSAEMVKGLMTMGYQDAAQTDAQAKNGLNSLSGYMSLAAASGTATTAVRCMSYVSANGTCNGAGTANPGLGSAGSVSAATAQTFGCSSGTDAANGCGVGTAGRMTGRIYANVDLFTSIADIYSESYFLTMNSATATVTTTPQVVSGKRMTSVDLAGSAVINPVTFSGQMQANANILGGIELDKTVTGTITGLTATASIKESLAFIHKINVNNPFSLSMQQQNLLWPGAAAQAQTGWWMAFEDQINIGNISPQNQVVLTNKVLMQALTGSGASPWPTNNCSPDGCSSGAGNTANVRTCTVPSINCALYRSKSYTNPDGGTGDNGIYGIVCLSLGDCLGGSLAVGTMNVPVNLNLPLTDLKLSAQTVVPNCWGTSRFC